MTRKRTFLPLCLVLSVACLLGGCYERSPELEKLLSDDQQPRAAAPRSGTSTSGVALAKREPAVSKAAPAQPKEPATDKAGKNDEGREAEKPRRKRRIPRIIVRERPRQQPTPTTSAPASAPDTPEPPEQPAERSEPTQVAETDDSTWKQYLSVEELRDEIVFLLNQMELKLRTRKDFDRYFRELEGDAAVLGILAVILQRHEEADPKTRRLGAALAEISMDLAIASSERSAETYEEARQLHQEALALMRGQENPTGAEEATWEDVASLADLMARIDLGYKRLRGGVNGPTFEKDSYILSHEARVLAILSRVSSFYRRTEPTYVRYAREMERWAAAAAKASEGKNRDEARRAVSQINRVCNECHRAFRLERGTGNSLDF